MHLYNKVDKRILKEQLKQETFSRVTISFYQYAQIGNPQVFRDHLFILFDDLKVFGRIHVATEGVNAQMSVPENNFEQFVEALNTIEFLKNIRLNIAVEDNGKSFYKLKIKVRDNIVADGIEDPTFDPSNTGNYLSAQGFNELTGDQKSMILVDMRNHYESEVGHFKNAIAPDVDTFRDSLPEIEEMLKGNEDKKLIMYCTGGIRCEKASAYFKHKGFENVFHLEGGIINYKRQIENQKLENRFIGKNFVFDERLGERITDDVIAQCHQCGATCDDHTNCENQACHLLFIQCEDCKKKFKNCCSQDCTDFNDLPEETQKELRKGKKAVRNIFRKGRSEKLKYKK